MAKIIVFSNRKGGTGKSTLCIQFANYLVSKGHNVAVLDADPQQSIIDLRNREVTTNPDVKVLAPSPRHSCQCFMLPMPSSYLSVMTT